MTDHFHDSSPLICKILQLVNKAIKIIYFGEIKAKSKM